LRFSLFKRKILDINNVIFLYLKNPPSKPFRHFSIFFQNSKLFERLNEFSAIDFNFNFLDVYVRKKREQNFKNKVVSKKDSYFLFYKKFSKKSFLLHDFKNLNFQNLTEPEIKPTLFSKLKK
jgi:hypothetical protein